MIASSMRFVEVESNMVCDLLIGVFVAPRENGTSIANMDCNVRVFVGFMDAKTCKLRPTLARFCVLQR